MRDVKRKICMDLDMAGLMDDENGMEVMVRGNIISLHLPIHLVYEQVWLPAAGFDAAAAARAGGFFPMEIVYRLQGLDGEATEALIDALDDTSHVEVDDEKDAAMTVLMSETKGLALLLQRLTEMDSNSSNSSPNADAQLEPLLLDVLFACCRLRVNRLAALHLGAVDVLLARISSALQLDPLPASVERMLLIVEQLVEQANRLDPLDSTLAEPSSVDTASPSNNQDSSSSSSQEVRGEQLAALLQRVGSPAVREQPKIVQLLAHVLPFLTYGNDSLMCVLVHHFLPHLELLMQSSQECKASLVSLVTPMQQEAHIHQQPLHASTQECEAYVDCFVSVVQRMGNEATACQLRAKLTDARLVERLAQVVADTLPAADVDKQGTAWAKALATPCLPHVLQLLTGISRGYEAAQTQVAQSGSGSSLLMSLHALEEMSSEQQMGSLAEQLLLALSEGNPQLTLSIAQLREATVDKKRVIALAQRERLLQEMGLGMGQDAAKAFSEQAKAMGWDDQDLSDDDGLLLPPPLSTLYPYTIHVTLVDSRHRAVSEAYSTFRSILHFLLNRLAMCAGLVCVICHEGYKYKPEEVLGVYVLSTRCSIAQVRLFVFLRLGPLLPPSAYV